MIMRLSGVSNRVLNEYSFSVKTVTTIQAASELMNRGRFDLAVYDLHTPGAIELAAPAKKNKPGVVFAILDDSKAASISDKRIHFSLQKPLTADLFSKSVKAAYGLVVREKRAAFRHPVQIVPSSVTVVDAEEKRSLENASILNLNYMGLCLSARGHLPQGAILQINFALPESKELVHVTATVVWTHVSGRVGVKFVSILAEERRKLQDWLDSMLSWDFELLTRATPRQYAAEPLYTN